jgi:anti-sigma B factor antagonist
VPELALDGDIDFSATRELWRAATCAMDRFGPYVVMDLSGVTFIDVAGLGILVHVQEEAARRGGRLTLASVPTNVAKLMRLTGVDHQFEFRAP